MNKQMFNDLINKFIIYNKKELYEWLMVSMLHPSNQKYLVRFELLIHTLIGIDEDKFQNNLLDKNEFENFIRWFEKNYSNYFIIMEDFEPFDQLKLIPLFLDGKKYYFFYGTLERHYEFIKQLYDILFSIKSQKLKNVKVEFLNSLNHQTMILNKLGNDIESKNYSENIYIPSIEFYNKYKTFFEVKNIDEQYLHNSKKITPLIDIEKMFDVTGSQINKKFNIRDVIEIELNDDELYHYEVGINNFNGLYTKIDSKYFYIPFQNHIEIFYNISNEIISNNPQLLSELDKSLNQRIIKSLSYFFYPQYRLDGIIDDKQNICGKSFDTLVQIDNNKIILFKFISYKDKINEVLDKTFQELNQLKQNENEIFMYKFDRENNQLRVNQIPIDKDSIKVIMIFEKININYMLALKENWKEKDIYLYNFLDLKAILELLNEKETDNNIALWQYLEAEKKQSLYNNIPFQMDTLDSFALYYENETFNIMGKQPNLMMITPHSWSEFYNNYIYEKYQDNIYELMKKEYPNSFNHIKHISNNTYEYIDTSTLNGGRCIKYNNKLIWITYPPFIFNLTDDEMKVVMFIAEFISFYIDRYKAQLFDFLKNYGFDFDKQNIMIVIFTKDMINSIKQLEHLKVYINDSNKDIIFTSQIRKFYNELYIAIICPSKLSDLENILNYKNVNCEKDIFIDFVVSLLKALEVKDSQQIASEFVNSIWDMDKRAFIVETKQTKNPNINKYNKPIQVNKSLIAKVNQELVEYLKEANIEIKEYWGDEAKKLNNFIFEFLQKRLEELLSQFNDDILLFAYKQIEYIEATREKNKLQMEFDSQKYIEFDISEKYNEEKIEISELSTCNKHILHSILKVNPNGDKNVSEYDWYYLLAYAKIINETIQRSDQLHYGLSDCGIKITELYELIDIDKELKIDFLKHYKETTNKQIASTNKRFEKILNQHDSGLSIFDKELNEAWHEEYGFYLDDMIIAMNALGQYYNNQNKYFPLYLLLKEEIFEFINNIVIEKFTLETIEKILDFLSLGFSTFKEYKYIDYSLDRLMTKKERLNLSPFIKLYDKYLFGNQMVLNSMNTWIYFLLNGDIPYTLDKNSLIKKELENIHNKLSKELEQLAYQEAIKVIDKKYVLLNIEKFQTISKKFPQKPPCGEIDLLIANLEIKTLFVLDAKKVNQKFQISAINRELNKFFNGKKSYLNKLNKKVQFVKDNLYEFLNYFGITDKDNWQIQKGFIVDRVYASAFYKDEKVNFILIDELKDYLKEICKV